MPYARGVRDLRVGLIHRVVQDGKFFVYKGTNERYVEAVELTDDEAKAVLGRAGPKFQCFVDSATQLLDEYAIEGEPVTETDADGSVSSVIEMIFSIGRSGLLHVYASQRVVDRTLLGLPREL